MAYTKYWFTDKRRLGIVEKRDVISGDYTCEYGSPLTAGTYAIRYYGRPTPLSEENIELASDEVLTQIPAQFHQYAVSHAISAGYKDPRNMNFQNAAFFQAEYNSGVKEGKKFARRNYLTTSFIQPQEY